MLKTLRPICQASLCGHMTGRIVFLSKGIHDAQTHLFRVGQCTFRPALSPLIYVTNESVAFIYHQTITDDDPTLVMLVLYIVKQGFNVFIEGNANFIHSHQSVIARQHDDDFYIRTLHSRFSAKSERQFIKLPVRAHHKGFTAAFYLLVDGGTNTTSDRVRTTNFSMTDKRRLSLHITPLA